MNIPIKTSKSVLKSGAGRRLKYPFDKVKVGKYLEFHASTANQLRQYYVAVRSARYYAKRQTPNWKFVSRVVDGVGEIHRIE